MLSFDFSSVNKTLNNCFVIIASPAFRKNGDSFDINGELDVFLGYIHFFRALAILFIVCGHTIDTFSWNNESLERTLRIFVCNGSVLFVFIAGYLFQHLSGKFSALNYYRTKIKNVIVPYLIISVPAIIAFVLFFPRDNMWDGFYDNSWWQQVILFYLTGKHLAPLWFIPMIAIFYLVAPLLIKADRNALVYILLPFMVVGVGVISMNRGLPLQNFIYFLPVYLLGMFCSHYRLKLNPLIKSIVFLLVSAGLVLVFGVYELFYSDDTMGYENYLQKLAMSLFFLGLFIRFNEHLTSKFVGRIADTSFGVFFIHSYFITAGRMAYQHIMGVPPAGNIFIYLLMGFGTLLFCVYLITLAQRIFGPRSRMLVGS